MTTLGTGKSRNLSWNPGRTTDFSLLQIVQIDSGDRLLSFWWVLGVPLPGILLPEREADYCSSSSVEVKKSWCSTSIPYAFFVYTGTNLRFILENVKYVCKFLIY